MQTYDVINPMTGQKVASYPLMNAADVERLVKKAREKQEIWARVSLKERAAILNHAAEVLAENATRYAERIAAENGKTVFDALIADIFTTCDVLKYYAENLPGFMAPVKVRGNPMQPGRKYYYTFEPKGVVAVIAPWNYLFVLCAGPTITAVAAGNAVVLKPASQTTDSGLIVKEVLEKGGLPEGVVNVITGSGSVSGQALIDASGIDMFFFTGSTEVGRKVNIKAAERLIPAIMELGGKDAAIVTRNADLERVAYSIAWGAFTNCGQTCIGIEMCLVDRSIHDEFMKKLMAVVDQIKMGKACGQVGSMTVESQLKTVQEQLTDAIEKGASLWPENALNCKRDGMCFPPIILTNVTLEMKLMKDETFGPLLPVIPYDTIDDAIRIANSTPFGLSGAVFTRDMGEGRMIASRIKTGSVSINDTLMVFSSAALPFGGVKESGLGVYHSDIGLHAFSNIKSIIENTNSAKKDFFHYPVMPGSQEGVVNAIRFLFTRGISKKIKNFFKLLPFLIKMLKEGK